MNSELASALQAKWRHDEMIVRCLLEQWVSELEPAVAYGRDGRVLGLTVANTPLGFRPFIFRGRS